MSEEPENHTLHLLREMRDEMRQRFDGLDSRLDRLEQRQEHIEQRQDRMEQRLEEHGSLLVKIIDAVTSIAAVQEQQSALLSEMVDRERITAGRLNAVEARLGRIEGKLGLALA